MERSFGNPRAITTDRLRGPRANARTFVNDRLRGRGTNDRLRGRGEEEALKEQQHRRALAFLETIRRQQNGPLAAGGPVSALGRSLGEQQIDGPGGAAADVLGLDPGKVSNGGFASLQRNAPVVADANNSPALGAAFGDTSFTAAARGPAPRRIGGDEEEDSGSQQAIENARAAAINRLASYISGAKVTLQAKEDGAVALYDPVTGKTRYLFRNEAGRGRNGRFDYRFNKKRREIILAWAHSHPKQGKRGGRGVAGRKGTDRDNESIRDNPDDQALSERAPLILKTPSGNLIICVNGTCRDY